MLVSANTWTGSEETIPANIEIQRQTADSCSEFYGVTMTPAVDGLPPPNTSAIVKPFKGTLGFSRLTVSPEPLVSQTYLFQNLCTSGFCPICRDRATKER